MAGRFDPLYRQALERLPERSPGSRRKHGDDAAVGSQARRLRVNLQDAVRMVTANPSRLLGLPIARGHESVRVGAEASLTVLRVSPETLDLEVQDTIVAGRSVYTAPST